MTNRLTNAENLNETMEIATKAIGKVVGVEVSCICFDEELEEKKKEKSGVRRMADMWKEIHIRSCTDSDREFGDIE